MRLWICVLKVYMYVATHIKGACQAVFTCGQMLHPVQLSSITVVM